MAFVGCSKGRLCTVHTCTALVCLYWTIFRYRTAFLPILSWAWGLWFQEIILHYETPFNAIKYISDSVISLQEALMLCPAQDTSSQSSGQMDSPTPSAGECVQPHSGTPVWITVFFWREWSSCFQTFSFSCFQAALLRTHHLQTARTRRGIES